MDVGLHVFSVLISDIGDIPIGKITGYQIAGDISQYGTKYQLIYQ